MKNRFTAILLGLTCAFVVFTLGFLLGRNNRSTDVLISRVPAVTDPLPTGVVSAQAESIDPTQVSASLLNINTATAAQLETLPEIGPVLARRIVDYRLANGPFTSVSQLTQVEGIGQKILTEILPYITAE